MLNLFIFWRKKTKFVHIKQSLYLSFRPFCQWRNWFSVNHLSRAKSPQKLTNELYMKRKAFPLLFTCNSSSLATGARTEAFFVGVAVLPKLPLAFRQKTRSCLKSPDIFPRFIVEAFFGLRSNLNRVDCCQVNLSLFPQQTAELLKQYLASRQQP